MNTRFRLFTVWIALAITATAFTSSHGQDPNFKPPGSEEAAAVDPANVEIDKVYKQLTSKLDAEQQKSLKEAQRGWINGGTLKQTSLHVWPGESATAAASGLITRIRRPS